jgi:hypothetical protein
MSYIIETGPNPTAAGFFRDFSGYGCRASKCGRIQGIFESDRGSRKYNPALGPKRRPFPQLRSTHCNADILKMAVFALLLYPVRGKSVSTVAIGDRIQQKSACGMQTVFEFAESVSAEYDHFSGFQ